MTFIRNNYFKILVVLWTVIGIPFLMYRGYEYNLRSSKVFFESNVIGKIKGMRDGSGGYEVIQLSNGEEYRFLSPDFDDKVVVGDSIYKPALKDTISIYNRKMEKIELTFLKPMGFALSKW